MVKWIVMSSAVCFNVFLFLIGMCLASGSASQYRMSVKTRICKRNCQTPISPDLLRWCETQCSPKNTFTSSSAVVVTKNMQIKNLGNSFNPRPTWIKATGTSEFPGAKEGEITTRAPVVPKTQIPTEEKTPSLRLTTKIYIYIDSKSRDNLERMVEDNIETQNDYFKLTLGLLAACVVIFILCFLWRSTRKPNRVSFTEDPVIIIHTGNV